MRTTLNIDDELLSKAQRITSVTEKVILIREGLRALIECETVRRLAQLGDSEHYLESISYRHSDW